MRFYIDLDDVLVNFIGGIHKALGIEYDYNKYPYERGKWDILPDVYMPYYNRNVTFEEVDSLCLEQFWANLKWMHDGQQILQAIRKTIKPGDGRYLLTTPMPNLGSWSGKAQWVERNIPDMKLIVSEAPKHLLASGDSILLDDNDTNVNEFVAAGGQAILIPRPWNSLNGWADRSLEVVMNSLQEV